MARSTSRALLAAAVDEKGHPENAHFDSALALQRVVVLSKTELIR
jgi:hypothetical protein